ncbi:MAG: hypothetical protein H0W70_15680, partial [Actinobacteria bacterium]|nr:hypothetical protein [Actinomycetota bacterium]
MDAMHGGGGVPVRTEIDEADLAQRRAAHDVDRTGEGLAIHLHRLAFADELVLLDGSADRRLPRESILRRDDDLAGGGGVAADQSGGDELAALDSDAVGMADAEAGVMTEADGPVLG